MQSCTPITSTECGSVAHPIDCARRRRLPNIRHFMLEARELAATRGATTLFSGLGFSGRERLPARALSQGQRRRAALARLAVSEALPLWILDEPFAALDAQAVERVQSLADEHLARGGMVVLTTHQDVRIKAPSVT